MAAHTNGQGTQGEETGARFLFVGLDYHRKGGDLVLQAFEAVHAALPSARLTIVTRLRHPPQRPGVRWLTDINASDLAGEYAHADIFVLASRFDTWGDVLVEAMSAELACICPDRAPFNEIVTAGVTGYCVDVEDLGALSAAMRQLALDQACRREMGKAARSRVFAQFTWKVVAAKLSAQIEAAVQRA